MIERKEKLKKPEKAQKKETELRDKARKGKLLIDVVVSEQMIKYPTDLDQLNNSRQGTLGEAMDSHPNSVRRIWKIEHT